MVKIKEMDSYGRGGGGTRQVSGSDISAPDRCLVLVETRLETSFLYYF